MLPAPITTAISTPRSATPWISAAIRSTRAGSVPYSSSPWSASPESFNRTRPKAGSATAPLLPHYEPGEAGDRDVLAHPRGDVGAQVLDRLALVPVLVDVLLLQQGDLALPLRDLAADDLLDDVVGLAVLAGLRLEHVALRLPFLVGDLLGADV